MSHVLDPPRLDMIARMSRVSSSVRHDADHTIAKETSPSQKSRGSSGVCSAYLPRRGDTDQALLDECKTSRQESVLSFTDPRWAGLFIHSVAIGFISTALPLTVYPFFTVYLNMEGTQTLSVRTLLALPWVFRPLFRIVMDCIPLGVAQQHRRYVMLGWLITFLSLGAIFFIDIPDPYYRDLTQVGKPLDAMTPGQLASLNYEAPDHGAIYTLLMSVGAIGYVLADVAADTLVTETAQRCFPSSHSDDESPFETRVTMHRYAATLASFLFMGFGMSGRHYGGDFDFTLSYNDVMLVLAGVASLPIPFAWLLLETRPSERSSLANSFQAIWRLFQNRAIAYVVACRFVSGVFAGISATPVNPIAFYWAGVQPLNDNVISFVSTLGVLVIVLLADKKGWVINYRLVILSANILVLVLDCGATLLTIWDVVRSQWVWIGLPVLEALPSGLDYVIVTVVISEITEPDSEALLRSVVTSVAFLTPAVASTITKYVDGFFDVANDDLARDTTAVRSDTTVVFGIAYVCQLLSLAWLAALPRDSDAARTWSLRSGSSRLVAVPLLATLTLGLTWSIVVHVLAVMDSTSCLRLVGGNGC